MMIPIEQRELERIRYWQGQMLRAGDFRRQVATDAQLRWWHNRAVHNAFGVAMGLCAVLGSGPGSSATASVDIDPGVAYDCFGRPLILLSPHSISLPPVSSGMKLAMTLVIRYRETVDFPAPNETSGVCLSCCGHSEAQETPDFAWVPAPSITLRDGVPLAQVMFDQGVPRFDPGFIPVGLRPLARPYLANGSTIPGSTPWTVGVSQGVLAIETIVDTAAAGFTRTPCYFAWLEGAATLFAQTNSRAVESVPGADVSRLDTTRITPTPPVTYFTHLEALAPTSFKFSVLVDLAQFDGILRREQVVKPRLRIPLYVCWLGCQSTSDTDQCVDPQVQKPCCS
jgi:hypothetical protein